MERQRECFTPHSSYSPTKEGKDERKSSFVDGQCRRQQPHPFHFVCVGVPCRPVPFNFYFSNGAAFTAANKMHNDFFIHRLVDLLK